MRPDLLRSPVPYHARAIIRPGGVANAPLSVWIDFLKRLCRDSFATLRPGGRLALLVANQTEKDLPAGHGYLDHAFFAYHAMMKRDFSPNGGSVAPWTARICRNTFARLGLMAGCSARFAT